MSLTPFFTIAIPTYNRAEMLRQTLESLRDQSFRDFEVLIGDNASTDGTESLIADFDDLPICYLRQERNIGPVANFNHLIEKATGRFFILHWDDDFLHQDFLFRAYQNLHGHTDRVAYATPHWHGTLGSGYITDLQTSPKEGLKFQTYFLRDEVTEFDGHRAAVKTLVSFPMVFPTTAVSLSALREVGGYFKNFEFGGDVVTMARVLSKGKVVYDPRVGGYTRIHGKNSSLNQDKKWKKRCHQQKLQAIIDFFEAEEILWREHLQKELDQMTDGRILMELKVLTRNECNQLLVREVYRGYRQKSERRGFLYWRKLVSRIGMRNAVYLLKCICN